MPKYDVLGLRRAWMGAALLMAGSGCAPPPLIPRNDAQVMSGPDAQVAADAGRRPRDAQLDPDAACASEVAKAELATLPVDIIWLVDNSASMEPAIREVQDGLDDFANLIGDRDLDYQVILLSMLEDGNVPDDRHGICIPRPLAGDSDCGDGDRFHHVDVDVRSTLQIEQFLGTLAQTEGYRARDDYGSAPWSQYLRDDATRSIVFVTDDNARMVVRRNGTFARPRAGQMGDPEVTADFFEHFGGGQNPFSSLQLPEGILEARWEDGFDGYVVHAMYGWGSAQDGRCRYEDGTLTESAGPTYTELVQRTGGARAQICADHRAWSDFFESVATAVERESRIACEIDIPEAPEGFSFEPSRINVLIDIGDGDERLGRVRDAEACDHRGGWHYDDEQSPSSVVLCPTTCEQVQGAAGETRSVEVQFGCATILI